MHSFDLKELDSRNKGKGYNSRPNQYGVTGFQTMAQFVRYGRDSAAQYLFMKDFIRLREWCTETWGPSTELDVWLAQRKANIEYQIGKSSDSHHMANQHWSYSLDTSSHSKTEFRIFLAQPEDVAFFKLRWC